MHKKMAFLMLLSLSSSVFAANASLATVPSGWVLQNYVSDQVYAFNTGSSCTNGELTLGSNASDQDKNRFWSMIMAAKISKQKIMVYYEDSGAPNNCVITSFLLDKE